jgi:hypothetical protein
VPADDLPGPPPAQRRVADWIFRLAAIGACLGALYHVAGILRPAWTEPASPARHAVFVGVNLALAAGLLRRPRAFLWLFAPLAAQQIYGHGLYGWTVLREERRIDWASVVVLLAMPTLLALLVQDRRGRVR